MIEINSLSNIEGGFVISINEEQFAY